MEDYMSSSNDTLKVKLINILKKNVFFRKIIRKIIYVKRMIKYKI